MKRFNPRSREGSDQPLLDWNRATQRFQSTLPRGERPGSSVLRSCGFSFQSTLPRGERRMADGSPLSSVMFQSTLPRGERPLMTTLFASPPLFQSTLPRGERPASLAEMRAPPDVSIHAPARGATRASSKSHAHSDSFNPRSREGSDLLERTENQLLD